jgi:hypothetical protein
MEKLIYEPLFYIFFVYGTSFLVMAFVVFRGIKKATSIALVNSYYALALFGLSHGLTELIDWARFIVKTTGSGEISALKYASQGLLIFSFVVLLQFGLNLLTYRSEKAAPLRMAPAILFMVYVVALAMMRVSDVAQAGLIARYTFGFAGALLSGVALFVLARTLREILDSAVVQGLMITGASFCLYAVVGGLVVKPVFGLPIQLFRAACAFTIAVSSFYILGIFKADHSEEARVAEASAAAND